MTLSRTRPARLFLTTILAISAAVVAGCASSPKRAVAEEAAAPAQSQAAAVETVQPKYGPQATRLHDSHQYIKKRKAPDFWAFMPYYLPQQDGRSCSVASVAMLVNAARAAQKLTARDELVTQKGLLEKVDSTSWNRAIGDGGRGVSLDELAQLITLSLKAYGFAKAQVEVVHAEKDSAQVKARVLKILAENEASADNFVIANFLQSVYTGDPEGAIGHISPVGAYDKKHKRVLVLDSDRQYYEPYWVSEDVFYDGLATKDSTADKFRGLIFVKLAQ